MNTSIPIGEAPDMGDGRAKRRRRSGIRLITAMMAVALAAVFFAWVAAERKKRADVLTAEYHRLEDRLQWARDMHKLGYISKAQLVGDEAEFDEVESQLNWLWARPEGR